MRTLTDHKTTELNEHLDVVVMDEPGAGGANHDYQIYLLADPDPGTPKITAEEGWNTKIRFQNGPIKEAGINGISQEALLAIVIDRLRCFQAGPFACEENANALAHCNAALTALKSRTLKRIQRGVEGTIIR